jgi:hypothetical protein
VTAPSAAEHVPQRLFDGWLPELVTTREQAIRQNPIAEADTKHRR